jgi:hypothetical protein
MTQYFSFRQFRLWRAPLPTRVLLTLFSGAMALAMGVSVVMWRVRTHLTAAGARDYYLGNENTAAPGDAMRFARSVQELLDVTHAHIFEQAFLLFVLCHLFALTRVSDRGKTVVYIAAFATLIVDLAVPYLIRFVSPAWAPLQIVNSALMAITLLVLLAVPLQEMWFYRPSPANGEA